MNLSITSVKRVTTTQPEMMYVCLSATKKIEEGHVSVEYTVEINDIDFMQMTLLEIESFAISRIMQQAPWTQLDK